MAALNQRDHPELQGLYHVPNGGWRHAATAAALQRQGVKPGIPDIALDRARGGWFGLRIELKRFREGTPSEAQRQCLEQLRESGYRAVCCYGWRMAWDEILRYLALPPTISTEAPPAYHCVPGRRPTSVSKGDTTP